MSNPIFSHWKNAKLLSWLLVSIGLLVMAELGLNRDPVVRGIGCSVALVCSRVALYQGKLAARSGNIWKNYEEWADEQSLRALCQKRPEAREDSEGSGESWQPPTFEWGDAASEAVGFMIVGNSGYGKTSTAAFLAGLLTQYEASQVVVLDPHWNDVWEQLGLPIVGDLPEIEKILKALLKELNERKERKKKKLPLGDPILIISDEIGACLDDDACDSETITKALSRIGAEGRKFGITIIGINHSSDGKDLGISAQMRSNYAVVLVGAAARSKARLLGKEWMELIRGIAYPCIVSGSLEDAFAMHPTHGSYREFKKHGNTPKNLLPINQLEPKFLAELGVLVGAREGSLESAGSPEVPRGADDRTYLERLWNLEFEGLGASDEPRTSPYESMGNIGEDPGADSGSFPEIDGLDDEMLKLFIIAFRGEGIVNQDEFILSMWQIRKGSSPRYQRARERYQQVCKRYNL